MLRAGEAGEIVRGRILDRNGVVLAENPDGGLRSYPYGASVAHQIGYIRAESKEGGPLGIEGVERVYDDQLARGKDVKLALDVKIQQVVRQAMDAGGIKIGAAVILDCRNGDLLASVSLPTYDNNLFIPAISEENWETISRNSDHSLRNRSFTAVTPGSTFKVLAAMAAARTGNEDEVLQCTGYETYGNAKMACWIWNKSKGAHGELDLTGGLAQSCNCYFAQLVNKVGTDGLSEAAELLGLGSPTGCGFPNDSAGMIAGSGAWKSRYPKAVMTPHELAMSAIGQGTSQASPMQLAVLAATVANGEKVWVPRLTLDTPPQYRTDLMEAGWSRKSLDGVRSGMLQNVEGGIARAIYSDNVEIAGQSGTAQTVR
ncbi:MAG: hypothetical protein EOP84_33730, partial [Verrucomicrobiaceae bacterium]